MSATAVELLRPSKRKNQAEVEGDDVPEVLTPKYVMPTVRQGEFVLYKSDKHEAEWVLFLVGGVTDTAIDGHMFVPGSATMQYEIGVHHADDQNTPLRDRRVWDFRKD